MHEAYVVDAVRTPFRHAGGALAPLRAEELAAAPLRALLQRTAVDPAAVEDFIVGCATPVGEQGRNLARAAAIVAGLPAAVPGVTVAGGGWGLQAFCFGAMAVSSGYRHLVVAGGAEATSRASPGADLLRQGQPVAPAERLAWRFTLVDAGLGADLLARRHGIGRAEADRYTLESHRRTAEASRDLHFDPEIAGFHVEGPTGRALVEADEPVDPDLDPGNLARLAPTFTPDGVTTAGNTAPLADGAATVLLASADAVRTWGLPTRARVVALCSRGADPTVGQAAVVQAALDALSSLRLGIRDVDAVELDERHAAAALACSRALGLDPERVNQWGGALALGTAPGADGARMLVTLLGVLERSGGRFGLAVSAGALGQATAVVIDREVYA